MSRPTSPTGYTTSQISRLLGLSPARIRSYVHAGFLTPVRGRRGEFRFTFQDLVVLRAARTLAKAKIRPGRIRRALAKLQEQLTGGRSLTAASLTAEGGQVVARQDDQAWEPESGQRLLDLGVSELLESVAPLARREAEMALEEPGLDAGDWYELGCEAEATTTNEAIEAYRRALDLDPGHADAHLNLGRMLHEYGDVRAAEGHYRKAASLRPGDATAAFNLGVALEDLGRTGEALDAYVEAVEIDPGYADAYFNLAGLYEKLGKQAVAIRNLKIYRSLIRPRR